jgi:biopolymer transport protein ExbD/biopolymer transport protein TolR
LGDEPINVNQIGAILHQRINRQNQSIYLRADETVPFGVFADVMDEVKQAGITNVSIVTQPYNQGGKSSGK